MGMSMGNTSQIKRLLIVLFIGPLVFILALGLIRFGIDFFINQKRIGNSEYYLTYQVESYHPILIRKRSFFGSQKLWESRSYVYYVFWDESYILFPIYSTSYSIESINIIRYAEEPNITNIVTMQPKDSTRIFHVVDSLQIKLEQMKLKTIGRPNKYIYNDLMAIVP